MRFLFVAACLALMSPAAAEDAATLTVEQVIQIGNGLAAFDGYDDICKDGQVEKSCRRPYKLTGGVRLTIALDIAECRRIASAYTTVRQGLIVQYGRGGIKVPDDAIVSFNADDRKALDAIADVKLVHLKRSDLAMDENPFPPSILALLLPILH